MAEKKKKSRYWVLDKTWTPSPIKFKKNFFTDFENLTYQIKRRVFSVR